MSPGMRLAALLIVLAAPWAAAQDVQPPRQPVTERVVETRTGERFAVHCHFEDASAVAERAVRMADAAWPIAARLIAGAAEDLPRPPEIHLFRNTADYLVAEKRLTGGQFAQNRIFSSFQTRAAYGAVQPDLSDAALARVGLPEHMARQVAHEATHLVVYWSIGNHRHHPDWLAEGMATWVAQQVAVAQGLSSGLRNDPYSSTRMAVCRSLRRDGLLPEPRALFGGHVRHLRLDQRYAVWWAFFDFLMAPANEAATREMIGALRRLEAGPDFTRRLLSQIDAFSDPDALDRLNEGFRRHVDQFRPLWDEHYRALGTSGPRWPQLAYPDNNAVAWRLEPAGRKRYALHGAVEILPCANPQANLLLGRSAGGFISVGLRIGADVTVFDYDAPTNTWKRLAHQHADVLRTGTRHALEIRVDGDELRVLIDGKQRARADVGEHPMTGSWGLGVQAGGAAIWDPIELR